MSVQIAIDLGSYQTRLTFSDREQVVTIASNVVVEKQSNRMISIGQDAQEILGRTSSEVDVFSPVSLGCFTDYTFSKAFLEHCLHQHIETKKMRFRQIPVPPELFFIVSPEITEVQHRAIKHISSAMSVRKVECLVRPLIASLSESLVFQSQAKLHLLIDCGFESTSISVLQFGKVVAFQQTLFGGKNLSADIAHFLKTHHKLEIGFKTAEKIKDIGGRSTSEGLIVIRGRDVLTSLPKSIKLNLNELKEVFEGYVDEIMEQLARLAQDIGPELIEEALLQGFSLFGGMAIIERLKQQIETVFGTAVIRPEVPDNVYHQGVLQFFALPKSQQRMYYFTPQW